MENGPDNVEELISRVALGERAAFRSLYAATAPKLLGVCLRILKDRSEAEDALQEVYVKIWRSAAQYAASRHNPMAWLVVIARNHSIDRLRARKPGSVEFAQTAEIADDRPNPERMAISSTEGDRIEECMEKLEPAHAEAIRGAYVDGYSYAELAARHDVPLNTMRTWLRRSLVKLKKCLDR